MTYNVFSGTLNPTHVTYTEVLVNLLTFTRWNYHVLLGIGALEIPY